MGNTLSLQLLSMSINVVWLKKDLRLEDHAPLNKAHEDGLPVVVLYVLEPEYWTLPDTSARQFEFVKESLFSLAGQLQNHQMTLTIRKGDVIDILSKIQAHVPIRSLLSHEETGNGWTFNRDVKVKRWAKEHNVNWLQYRQKAVVRGPNNRDYWKNDSDSFFESTSNLIFKPTACFLTYHSGLELLQQYPGSDGLVAQEQQKGGVLAANTTLSTFFDYRIKDYLYGISSPIKSVQSSSRLSPYLSNGILSLRQVMQQTWELDKELGLRNKSGFMSRLYWHSHFVQKFETEPEHEYRAVNRSLDKMRRDTFCEEKFNGWRTGNTGVPFVDACMRMLNTTGWINFRMRAMLTAYSSYQLWLHWERPAQHLAQMFIDYEPGIHYPQIQMQSGVTGINPFRMYNPVKQGEKYDKEGRFIRKWVPELDHVPTSFIHQPWLYPNLKQDRYYKTIPPEELAREAKASIKAYYSLHKDQDETKRVISTHASRQRQKKRKSSDSSTTNNSKQISLF